MEFLVQPQAELAGDRERLTLIHNLKIPDPKTKAVIGDQGFWGDLSISRGALFDINDPIAEEAELLSAIARNCNIAPELEEATIAGISDIVEDHLHALSGWHRLLRHQGHNSTLGIDR